jgi:hypothetical protein
MSARANMLFLTSTVVVVDALDIVLAEEPAQLHLHDNERVAALVCGEPMPRTQRHVDGLSHRDGPGGVVHPRNAAAVHDEPVFRPVPVALE